MNRLTEPKGSQRKKSWNKDEILEVLLKLQEYEDTDLAVKEIEELQNSNLNLSATVEVLESEKANLLRTLEEANERIEELEGQFAYECECNADLVKLQEENEELKKRLENIIELPCKIGDTLWFASVDAKNAKDKGFVTSVEFDYRHIGEIASNFGVNLFSTKEQAKARLKELQDDRLL